MTVLTLGAEPETAVPIAARAQTRAQTGAAARPRVAAVLRRVGLLPAESPSFDIVDCWGEQSFPASDPPSNW